MALSEADAILTVGGGKLTYLAGLAAIVAKKRIVPIASFGGASEQLLVDLMHLAPSSDSPLIKKLNGPWTKNIMEIAIEILRIRQFPKLLIIHGRSDDWYDLKEWLHDVLKLDDIVVMKQQFGVGLTLPEKFESLATRVDAAIALATPDDHGGLKGEEAVCRARQNVWLEVGWFWGRLGRQRVMVLCKDKLDIPSDLQGLELFMYKNKPRECSERIRSFVDNIQKGG